LSPGSSGEKKESDKNGESVAETTRRVESSKNFGGRMAIMADNSGVRNLSAGSDNSREGVAKAQGIS
jgi:hypothetical protein